MSNFNYVGSLIDKQLSCNIILLNMRSCEGKKSHEMHTILRHAISKQLIVITMW